MAQKKFRVAGGDGRPGEERFVSAAVLLNERAAQAKVGKDLGESTAEMAKAIKAFDPDSSWTRVPPAE